MVTNMHWSKWFNFPFGMNIFDNPCISVPLKMVWSTLTSHLLFGSNWIGQDHTTDCTINQQNLRAKGVLRISIITMYNLLTFGKGFYGNSNGTPSRFSYVFASGTIRLRLLVHIHATYICSGWLRMQSKKDCAFNSPMQILWTAVNRGNLKS